MIPSVTSPAPVPSSAPAQNSQKTTQQQMDTPRSSVGERAGANLRAETARAIDAPKQSAVTQRLQDQDKKERPDTVFDDLVGPDPTFAENLLERQARVALDPPEIGEPPSNDAETIEEIEDEPEDTVDLVAFEDPPPTPTERAEASFAETRTIASEPETVKIDVAR